MVVICEFPCGGECLGAHPDSQFGEWLDRSAPSHCAPSVITRYGGLLLTSAHGIIGLELSGHLSWDKWHATAEDFIELLIALLPPMP